MDVSVAIGTLVQTFAVAEIVGDPITAAWIKV
jgi:hypothetical protein